jgi:orotate phosphoribosyltransferase-like protein
MKPSFKQFKDVLLSETLSVDAKTNTVVFSMQQQSYADKDEINTFIKAGWYHQNSGSSGNIDIYSRYLYKHSKAITNILQSLKGSGPHDVSEKTVSNFLKQTATSAAEFIKTKKIDTIIFPKSGSDFLKAYIEEIQHQLGSYEVNVISDAIIKKQISDIELKKGDMTELINFDHKSFNTMKDSTIKALEKQIAKNIAANHDAGKGVSVKGINKMQAKFVTNFLELVKDLSDDLDGKNVLLVDDILSSGTTFAEMVRIIKKENVKSLVGMTIFKNTGNA